MNQVGLIDVVKMRREIAEKLFVMLDADQRVNFVLTVGSTAQNAETELSDIDICVVMKDDNGLNQIMRELNIIFHSIGNLVSYYEYNPYHYYAIYGGSIPLDIYFISSSVYFIIRKPDNKIVVDHSQKGVDRELETTAGGGKLQRIVKQQFLKGWIRTFRLLSKIRKRDYITLLYILNQIREDQIIPLLVMVSGYDIPHSKAVKLDDFSDTIRPLFIRTFANPSRESTLDAVKAMAEILYLLYVDASTRFDLSKLDHFATDALFRINSFE
jgi:predicted nucleotidyltransferase